MKYPDRFLHPCFVSCRCNVVAVDLNWTRKQTFVFLACLTAVAVAVGVGATVAAAFIRAALASVCACVRVC